MIKSKRWQRVTLLTILLLLCVVALIFWPQAQDLKSLAVSATRHDVRILRDTWGVPHIFGVTDADAAYGLAYAHAEDDFLTIQQILAAARGQLASLYGAKAAPNDYMVHLLRIWEVVNANYEKLYSETRAIVEAYADGLNHYAALHSRDVLPGLFPVTGKDVIAGSVHKSPKQKGRVKKCRSAPIPSPFRPNVPPTARHSSPSIRISRGPGRWRGMKRMCIASKIGTPLAQFFPARRASFTATIAVSAGRSR